MDKDIDALLASSLLDVPADFTHDVMRRVAMAPMVPTPARHPVLRDSLKEWALVAGGLLGAAQLASFVFAAWAVSSAG